MTEAAAEHSRLALRRAEKALTLEEDLAVVRGAALSSAISRDSVPSR
ncbi:MAG: hypothetical protein ABI689_13125 [Thermoanaerobaculia bacterium]